MEILIYFSAFFLGIIFLFSFFFFLRQKEKTFLKEGMKLALFLVTVPQETEKEREFSLENFLKSVEQFYFSLGSLKLGKVYLCFEIAVPRIGEEICFYVACHRKFSEMIEKQILGFWPKAKIIPSLDYNIFNPEGHSVGAVAFLSKPCLFPLKTISEFATDPLSSICSVFTKLAKEGEGAAIQILIKPSKVSLKKTLEKITKFLDEGMTFQKAVNKALNQNEILGTFSEIIEKLFFSSKKKEEKMIKKSIESFPLFQNQFSALSQKASQPLFETNLRILASAPTKERALQILHQLQSAFDQFNSPILNQIKFKVLEKKKLQQLFYHFSFRIFNPREKILLSCGELASLFHFPPPVLLIPQIKWQKAKQAPPPPNLPEKGVIIGKNVFRSQEKIVRILKEDRRRHFYIVGQTGTGKSALLQEMIRQDIENGEGVALIDPHGDLAEKVLGLIPPKRIEDVIYFDPGDYERPIGLNMLDFDPKYPQSKTFVVNEMLEIFEKLYNLKATGFGGPMFEQYMRNALLLIMEDPSSGNTLVEVPRVLADTSFRKYKLSKCQNIVVKNFWELEAEKAGGEAALANMVPYITSKMNIFIANDFVRPIIGQQKSTINFREIMDSGKILICNLSKGKLGDINSYLLGMIIVGKILIAAFSRIDLPEQERRDFYLYIDEFQNVTTQTISQVLAEARKYRLSLILAHQFIGQLDENTQKAIFGNVGSILAFRVGPDDAKYLVSQFSPVFEERDLLNFDNFNGALKLLIEGQTSKPFSVLTFPPKKENPEIARIIKEYSRIKYGRDRNQVEEEIKERLVKIYY